MTNEEYVASLRLLANWYEQHPNIPTPHDSTFVVYPLDTKEEAVDCMLALKPCEKEYEDSLFYLSRKFGGITLKFAFYRDAICTRRVVGTEMVPEETIPEKIIPAHVKEIIEWDCSPLLASESSEDVPF